MNMYGDSHDKIGPKTKVAGYAAAAIVVCAVIGWAIKADAEASKKEIVEHQEGLKPFMTMDYGNSQVNAYEITPPGDTAMRCIIVAPNHSNNTASTATACFPAGEPDTAEPSTSIRPFKTISGAYSYSDIKNVYEITPPSNRNERCIITVSRDFWCDVNISIACYSIAGGPK